MVHGGLGGKRCRPQDRWDSSVSRSTSHGPSNPELHHVVCIRKIGIPGEIAGIAHGESLACEVGEVNNDLVALCNRQYQSIRRNGARNVAAICGNYDHGDPVAVAAPDFELVGTADTCIEEPEAVFAGLDVEIWPWDAVGMDHVAEVCCGMVLAKMDPGYE
jgi:hypothetical protein